MHLTRLKVALEVAAVGVGLILGVLALRDQLTPHRDLVAEIMSVEARLPADLMEHMKSLPDKAKKSLLNDETFLELVLDETLRESIAETH